MQFLTAEMMGRCALRMAYATNIEYAGYAAAGSATSAAVWAISKTTYSNNQPVSVEWADGDLLRDNVWNDYAGLTYE